MRVPDGAEWDAFAGLEISPARIKEFLAAVPFAQKYPRRHTAPVIDVPETLAALFVIEAWFQKYATELKKRRV